MLVWDRMHGNRAMRMKVTDVVVGGFEGQDAVIPAIGKPMAMMRVGQRFPADRLIPSTGDESYTSEETVLNTD